MSNCDPINKALIQRYAKTIIDPSKYGIVAPKNNGVLGGPIGSSNWWMSGYIYAPYQPIYSTDTFGVSSRGLGDDKLEHMGKIVASDISDYDLIYSHIDRAISVRADDSDYYAYSSIAKAFIKYKKFQYETE
jgi:hypothetical protein